MCLLTQHKDGDDYCSVGDNVAYLQFIYCVFFGFFFRVKKGKKGKRVILVFMAKMWVQHEWKPILNVLERVDTFVWKYRWVDNKNDLKIISIWEYASCQYICPSTLSQCSKRSHKRKRKNTLTVITSKTYNGLTLWETFHSCNYLIQKLQASCLHFSFFSYYSGSAVKHLNTLIKYI